MMGFSIAVIIIVLIVLYSLARTAGESDRILENIREQSLLSKFKRNIRESGTSIKTKNTNLHIAGRTGALAAGAVTEQVEGGHEV